MIKIYLIFLKKEFKDNFLNLQIIVPVFILPFILLFLVPIFISLNIESKEQFLNIINSSIPFYFLLISLSISNIFSSSSFVMEKEAQTMESLFYTPVTIRQLFFAKILAVFSLVMILISFFFFIFGLFVNFFVINSLEKLIFPDLKWIIYILWIIPSIVFFMLSFIVWVSSWAKSFVVTNQISSLMIFPIILVFNFIINGMNNSVLFYFIIGNIVWFIDFFLLFLQSKRWEYEKFLK